MVVNKQIKLFYIAVYLLAFFLITSPVIGQPITDATYLNQIEGSTNAVNKQGIKDETPYFWLIVCVIVFISFFSILHIKRKK